MDERKTTPVNESTEAQSVQSEGRKMLEQAFSRGPDLSDVPSVVTPERSENSVMEGLPPAKAERIAAMRRELAELQRQLIEAQQRIAKELQGRAEDAERFEALEARVHAQEVKTQEDATQTTELVASLRSQLASVTATADDLRREIASHDTQIADARRLTEQHEAQSALLTEAKTQLETRDGELATRTTERDTALATTSRLEGELEDQRKQHGEITSQLEQQLAAVRDANALVATRDGELAAITSERDAVKGEVAAGRAKLREIADQLAGLGRNLLEGAPPASSSEPEPAVATKTERLKPPPVPPLRATATEPSHETILEVTEEPKSLARIGLVLISGVLLGCLATVAIVKWTSSSSASADNRQDLAAPSAAVVPEHATEPTPPVTPSLTVGAAPSLPPVPSSPPAPAKITTDGVIVIPQEAADHRVFVDGRVVPIKNSRAVVPCGSREIRIGSHGTSRTLDVTCGGETAVPVDTRDR